MSTHPIGKGTTNVTVNMPDDLKRQLADLAEKSGTKSLGSYIKEVLRDYAEGGAVVEKPKVTRKRKPSKPQ